MVVAAAAARGITSSRTGKLLGGIIRMDLHGMGRRCLVGVVVVVVRRVVVGVFRRRLLRRRLVVVGISRGDHNSNSNSRGCRVG